MNRKALRLEVTAYRGPGTEVETRSLTREELGTVGLDRFDYVLNGAEGTYAFRDVTGERIKYPIDGSGMGRVCLDIIRAIQLHPGVFLDASELAELAGKESLLDGNNLAARVMAIRKAHADDAKDSKVFITRKRNGYAVLWPAELSWIWIDRIRQPDELLASASK